MKKQITHCPPADKETKRKKPTCHKCKQEIKGVPKQGHDELCQACQNKGQCEFICLPMKWIDGNIERREKLLNDDHIDESMMENYNETLHERIRAKQLDRMEEIRTIKDIKIRAVAALLSAEISITDISKLFQNNRSSVYKILNIKSL